MPHWDSISSSQYNAELGLYRQLLLHPSRTDSPGDAKIFVAPIFMHLSYMAGR
jgi:hypothetical protein